MSSKCSNHDRSITVRPKADELGTRRLVDVPIRRSAAREGLPSREARHAPCGTPISTSVAGTLLAASAMLLVSTGGVARARSRCRSPRPATARDRTTGVVDAGRSTPPRRATVATLTKGYIVAESGTLTCTDTACESSVHDEAGRSPRRRRLRCWTRGRATACTPRMPRPPRAGLWPRRPRSSSRRWRRGPDRHERVRVHGRGPAHQPRRDSAGPARTPMRTTSSADAAWVQRAPTSSSTDHPALAGSPEPYVSRPAETDTDDVHKEVRHADDQGPSQPPSSRSACWQARRSGSRRRTRKQRPTSAASPPIEPRSKIRSSKGRARLQMVWKKRPAPSTWGAWSRATHA